MTGRLHVTVALAALCTAAPAAWQQSTFRASVELVRVDVVVTDPAGQPIEGLKAEDFTVFDRRKAQTVSAFEEIRHPRASAAPRPLFPATLRVDVGSNFTAATDRFVVILLDDLHTYKGRTDTVKDIARRLVNDMGPQASMAVIFSSGDHSTEVTEDRSVLLAAIDTFRGRRGIKRPISASDERGGALMAVPDPVPVGNHNAATTLADFDANMSVFASLQSAARARRPRHAPQGVRARLRRHGEGSLRPVRQQLEHDGDPERGHVLAERAGRRHGGATGAVSRPGRARSHGCAPARQRRDLRD